MKKRIIALLLVLSVLCGSISCAKRANAAPAVAVGVIEIGIVAWELLDLMIKGEEPAIAVAIETIIESGIDAFTNPESPFRQGWKSFWDNWGAGWENICDTIAGWFGAGEIELTEGEKLILSYEQYLQLCSQVIRVSSSSLNFTSGYNYVFLSADLSLPIPLKNLPRITEYFEFGRQSYTTVFFDKDTVVFPSWYTLVGKIRPDEKGFSFVFNKILTEPYLLDENFLPLESGINDVNNFFDEFKPSFYCPDINFGQFSRVFFGNLDEVYTEFDFCFVFSNGTLTQQPSSAVDISGMQSGILTTTGDYFGFLDSLSGFTSTIKDVDIDDYDNIIPDDSSLSIPVNPDLTVPIADQVIVGDVAGADDLPLSDYLANAVNITINVPSVIVTKFPFCIPYDLIRFLGVLAADPIPPVFTIPISTSPDNLAQWADNETIGQYVSPDDPMFEIDEEIVIDFAHIPLVQPICYTVFIVCFVIFLIHVTTKLIQH